MALSFHHPTPAPAFGQLPAPGDTDTMSFLQDVHPEVTDALLVFVYDPLGPAALDDLLNIPEAAAAAFKDDERAKKPRARTDDAFMDGSYQQVTELMMAEFVLPLPPPPPQPLAAPFVRRADAEKTGGGRRCQRVQSAAARERRNRISAKTAQLSRLIPGRRNLSTAEMLEEAARYVKLLQAQVGMLALMHTQKEKVPVVAQEQMHALLLCGSVQQRLATEGNCLVPRKLVDAVARDKDVRSNTLVNRDLARFRASLEE